MSESLMKFLKVIVPIFIVLGLGAVTSFYYYSIKRRDLFGGFIGGMVIGVIGALIGGYILDRLFFDIVRDILEFLALKAGFNVIAGIIGAFIALAVMNRLNHNKERKKY